MDFEEVLGEGEKPRHGHSSEVRLPGRHLAPGILSPRGEGQRLSGSGRIQSERELSPLLPFASGGHSQGISWSLQTLWAEKIQGSVWLLPVGYSREGRPSWCSALAQNGCLTRHHSGPALPDLSWLFLGQWPASLAYGLLRSTPEVSWKTSLCERNCSSSSHTDAS